MNTSGVVENSGHCKYSIGLMCFRNCFSLIQLVIYIYIHIYIKCHVHIFLLFIYIYVYIYIYYEEKHKKTLFIYIYICMYVSCERDCVCLSKNVYVRDSFQQDI